MKPPALADWLFTQLAPRHIRTDVLGDLHEEFEVFRSAGTGRLRAQAWYWRQVLGTLIQYRFARREIRSHHVGDPSVDGSRRHLFKTFAYVSQDLRLALRSLIRSPGFTGIAVLTLGLGIGANTTIFSVVQTVLLRPLPYHDPDRIVEIYETHPERGWTEMAFSHPNFWDLWERNETFESFAALTGGAMNLTGFEYPERLSVRWISADFFRVLGVKPQYGRAFLPGEDLPGANNRIALLGNGLWMSRFGGDPGVLGTSITLDGIPFTVVGILPPGEPFPGTADVYLPLTRGSNTVRNDHRLMVAGRLKPGITVEAAQADLETITAAIGNLDADGPLGVRIVPSAEWIADSQLRTALWVLMAAVGFLLMIACVNLANLLLARATGRQRETAVCAALGASRGRLTARMLTESVLLGIAGGGLGVALSVLGIRLVHAADPGGVPRLAEVGINPWVLAFTLGAALTTGLVTGLVPAFQTPYGNLLTSLRDGDRGVAGNRGQNRIRSVLVAAEVALSLVLLTGAGLLIRSFTELQRVDTGFATEDRLTFQVSLTGSYDGDETSQFFTQFVSRLENLPNVQAAGAVNMTPLVGGSVGMGIATEARMQDESAVTWVDWRLVTPDYFRTMGLPLLRGRNFDDRDRGGDPWRVVISQQLADRLWPGEDPVGRRAALWVQPDRVAEVIGVVGGMRERGPGEDETMVVYIPYLGATWSPVTFVVHATANPGALVPAIRAALAEVDPDLPLTNVASLDELVDSSVAGNRFNMLLLGIFAAVAMLLALAGIYGVIAYGVTRRTSEIGVRVALGASHRRVLRQIVGQAMRPVVAGIVLGLGGALAVSTFLSTLLFGIAATDPVTYATVAVVLGAAALVACYVPARRALRIDPKVALAAE